MGFIAVFEDKIKIEESILLINPLEDNFMQVLSRIRRKV